MRVVPRIRDGLRSEEADAHLPGPAFHSSATINRLEQPPLPWLLFCSQGVSVMIRHYLKQW